MPRETAAPDWTPPVFSAIQNELAGWKARPHKTAEEATEHLLSKLYRSGYAVLKVDKDAEVPA